MQNPLNLPASLHTRCAVFASMEWPQQQRLLDDLNDHTCSIRGKTWGEAQRARAPLEALHRRLQAIRDSQVRAWVNAE